MKSDELIALAVVIGALTFPQWKDKIPGGILPGPTVPVNVPSVPTPDAEAQKAVEAVVAAAKASPASQRYAAYWADMAQLVKLKPGVFPTTGKFRDFHKESSKLFFDLEAGATTGLGPPTDAAIMSMLGADDTKLDDAKAVRCFNALQWASSQ